MGTAVHINFAGVGQIQWNKLLAVHLAGFWHQPSFLIDLHPPF